MIICITSSSDTLDSVIDNHFGRCRYLVFADTETGQNEVVRNPGASLSHGSGRLTARTIIEHGGEAVVTTNIGPNALKALNEVDIKVYKGVNTPVMNLVVKFSKRELEEINTANVLDHFGTNEPGKHSTVD